MTLEVESIDRMYLNVYQPQLQRELGVVGFFRQHRGHSIVSAVLMAEMTRTFVASIESFAKTEEIPVVTFEKGQRKDDIAKSYRAKFTKDEGVVFIGKAQEKANVWRNEKRIHQPSGQSYPWQVRSTAMVNHYYGFIERLPRKHRYRVTPFGLRIALFYTRTYVSVLRPGLSQIVAATPPADTRLRSHFDKATEAIQQWCRDAKLAA